MVAAPFAVRGIVEGFYGTPWSHDARLEMIDFLARARHERIRLRAEGRRQAPRRVARAVRRRRAAAVRASWRRAATTPACGSVSRSRRASTSPTSRTPTAPRCSREAPPLLDAGVTVVPAAARRHPDATRARAAPGGPRDLAARRAARRGADARSRSAPPSTSGRSRRRTSPSSAPVCRPTSTSCGPARRCAHRRSRADARAGWTGGTGRAPAARLGQLPGERRAR